jgi:hypothetical protein
VTFSGTDIITVTGCYQYIPTYSLTINAYDCYGNFPVSPDVYVDGNYVGTASVTIQVPLGCHTISADGQVYDPDINTWVYFYYMVDSNYNYNCFVDPIYSDTTINVWYA